MNTCKLVATLCAATLPLLGADQPGTAVTTDHVRKLEKAPKFVPATADPAVGAWQGEGGLVAQVFLTPGGKYQANLLTAFDTVSNVIAVMQGSTPGEAISFSGNGWNATLANGHLSCSNGDKKIVLQHIVRTPPTLGAKPPKDAIVLFDGHSLDAWAKKNGKEWLVENDTVPWKILPDGALEIVPTTESIITHQKFGDCHLHLEFRTIGFPSKSAVFLEARYEININETYGHTEGSMTGGMDNSSNAGAPRVRAALPPLAWQTFDIDFRAPRFDASSKRSEKPRMTVVLNGVTIYCDQELDPPHGAAGRLGEAPTGPLMLQDHQTPLQYRNIWLVENGK